MDTVILHPVWELLHTEQAQKNLCSTAVRHTDISRLKAKEEAMQLSQSL